MKHGIVQQKIIDTASELFYQKGYNLTGINEIIAKAGIAKATLYSHFKSKEEICIAYLKHKNHAFLENIQAFVLSKPKGKKQILAIFDFLGKFYKDKEFNGCWCINTISELPRENVNIRTEIQFQKKKFLRLIQNLVNDNMETLTKRESEKLANYIYILYEGAISESHLHRENWPIRSAKKLCEHILA